MMAYEGLADEANFKVWAMKVACFAEADGDHETAMEWKKKAAGKKGEMWGSRNVVKANGVAKKRKGMKTT